MGDADYEEYMENEREVDLYEDLLFYQANEGKVYLGAQVGSRSDDQECADFVMEEGDSIYAIEIFEDA